MAVAEYYSRVNPDLLALIPPDARTVLEIGCGTGALAEAFRRINPAVRWFGVEANEDAYDVAVTRMTDCLFRDVEDEEIPIGLFFDGKPVVDCLILGDVLEHLRNPWEALRSMAEWLKPGGLVLACIPNVQHWTTVDSLLNGDWEYQDEGLLDRSHLRFFCLKNIREMFAGAGLEVFNVRGRPSMTSGDADLHHEFFKKWLPVADRRGPLWDQTRVYQYLVRALKPPAEVKPLHIHAVLGELCCALPRILEPMAMLSTIPGVECSISSAWHYTDPIPGIMIQQRFRQFDPVGARRLLDHGCLIIAEIDDDPEALHGVSDNDFAPLRCVHAVQVSTEALAEVVRQWNPEVAVFPNQIADLRPMKGPAWFQPGNEITLFYGAQNRESDWAPIMPALNDVLNDHPLVTVRVIHDRAFYDALETDNKKFGPFCDYATYRSALGSADIALLPLEPTRFNRCKSDLKFLECAAEGVVALMSEFAADQIIPHANDAYRCWIDLGHFEIVLQDLIEKPGYRRQTAATAYAYVRDHRLLGQHFRRRHEWYTSLIHRRSELHRSMLDRVPELRSTVPV